jgi:glycyl-tRNA synthetase beta chain
VRLPLLLEVGTEEIPDWMVVRSCDQLKEQIEAVLLQESLFYSEVFTDATPRRLVAWIDQVEDHKDDKTHLVAGPPRSIAYRGDVLTQAGLAFLRKQGATENDICGVANDPSRLYCQHVIPGRITLDILAERLPDVILKIHFPKSMYWTGKGGPRFIRPIRWIVALLGGEVVRFELAGVRSGNESSGHRRLGAARVPITIENYEQRLRENFVILSATERRKKIEDGIAALNVKLKPDPSLLETLVYLTEYPTPILGEFDPQFLELPEEVLITVMRHHQKYFSVEDASGRLAPRFVAVMNTNADPEGLVRRGNERVLRARFNDARFFWQADQRKKLADRLEDLAHVTFQAKLGSYLDKTNRVVELVKELGGDDAAQRAALLAKCDLPTELVKEFTELQGVVGGLYARAQGESEQVWQAIYDHYKPESMEDSIPRGAAGQLVSVADKLDTLRGCFRVGLIPTGSRDPFALRRAAQGVVKIMVEGRISAPMLLPEDDEPLADFFKDRIRFYFGERGFRYDEVNAIMAAGWKDLPDLEDRLLRLQASPNVEQLARSFKRIKKILSQAGFQGGSFNPDLLEPGPERDLYDEIFRIAGRPIETTIGELGPKLDRFFDEVLVNDPRDAIRANRLELLRGLRSQFMYFADFSEIVTNS